jgi:hypothetical protein
MEASGQLQAPAALFPGEGSQYQFDMRLGGPRSRSGHCGEKSLVSTGNQTPTFQPVDRHYTDWAIPARIVQPLKWPPTDLILGMDNGLCHGIYVQTRPGIHLACYPNSTGDPKSRYSEWLRAGCPRVRNSSPGRVKNFHFSISSRLALGSTQPPIQWVPGALPQG